MVCCSTGEDFQLSGTDIFVSYSSTDRPVARRFAEHFEREGCSVWWDAALYSGQAFDEVIERELRGAKAVVVLWSPRSVTSRWVRAEATLADRHNKLVPAIIEPCERPIIFELTHTVDLSHWRGEPDDPAWCAFLQDVKRLVARGAPPAATPKPPFGASPIVPPPAAEEAPAVPLQGGGAEQLVISAPAVAKGRTRPMVKRREVPAPARAFDSVADEFHCLEQLQDGRMHRRYVVSPAGLRIGRTPPADIIIPDPRVSRVHCLVELADDRLEISDLNSTNGTYIDGKRIHGRAFLNLGSEIRVGDVTFHHALRRRAEALQH